MNKKELYIYGLVFLTIQVLLNWGIFVTFPQMVAYAASKEDVVQMHTQLNRIEEKIDRLRGN